MLPTFEVDLTSHVKNVIKLLEKVHNHWFGWNGWYWKDPFEQEGISFDP